MRKETRFNSIIIIIIIKKESLPKILFTMASSSPTRSVSPETVPSSGLGVLLLNTMNDQQYSFRVELPEASLPAMTLKELRAKLSPKLSTVYKSAYFCFLKTSEVSEAPLEDNNHIPPIEEADKLVTDYLELTDDINRGQGQLWRLE